MKTKTLVLVTLLALTLALVGCQEKVPAPSATPLPTDPPPPTATLRPTEPPSPTAAPTLPPPTATPALEPTPAELPSPTPEAGIESVEEAVLVEIHSSNTKQDWMNQVVTSFNAAGFTTSAGDPIMSEVYHVGSGSSMNNILDGKIQPVVWSPGSDLWVTRFKQIWLDRTGGQAISQDCPATLSAPLVIAIWKPMAETLGWPDEPISWADLAALSTNPEGWAAYGHPEWGVFKFGHGHPDHSNSGMLTVVAEVRSVTGPLGALTVQDVKSEMVRERVGAVEQQVFHYGKKDTDLLNRMAERGPDYLHAVSSYEINVIKWNRTYSNTLRFPLVAIYPEEGTFWVKNPFCILDGAEWVSEAQAEAAAIFQDYLLSPEQQALTVDWGLRPADPDVLLHAPIDLGHGVVPAITKEQVPQLEYPTDELTGHILDVWRDVKKKSTVIMLLDTSVSMEEGDKINKAMEGAIAFIEQMHPADEIYVVTFSGDVAQLQPGGLAGSVGEEIKAILRSLYATAGGTALYQSVVEALDLVEAIKAAHESPRLYGIVLLSDGKNEIVGGPSFNDMLSRLPSGSEAIGVKIYTIAYGEGADLDVLRTLANRTNGKFYAVEGGDVQEIYFLISSEF